MAGSFSKLFAVVHRAWIGTGLAYSVGKIRYGLPPDAFDQVLACPNALEGMVGDVTQAEAEQDQLLSILRDELYVAVVSDVLDAGGLVEQAMDARLRPLAPGMRLVGRAHTVMTADVYVRPEEPYGPEIEAVDALRPGDVMVASTSRSERTCFWGELLSTAAVARSATGCAIDGHTRDALRIIDMGFPVFATGFRPVDSSSRSMVVGHGCPVEVGGVVVNPGDIIFGDYDGIVVIPPDRLADVVTAAHNKVTSENSSREMLQAGATLRDVYDRYGVL